jgi:hypothetical protein
MRHLSECKRANAKRFGDIFWSDVVKARDLIYVVTQQAKNDRRSKAW